MPLVCGTSLSLMDAGVLSRASSRNSLGLIKGDDFSVLSDILGDEDHLEIWTLKLQYKKWNNITTNGH